MLIWVKIFVHSADFNRFFWCVKSQIYLCQVKRFSVHLSGIKCIFMLILGSCLDPVERTSGGYKAPTDGVGLKLL